MSLSKLGTTRIPFEVEANDVVAHIDPRSSDSTVQHQNISINEAWWCENWDEATLQFGSRKIRKKHLVICMFMDATDECYAFGKKWDRTFTASPVQSGHHPDNGTNL